MSTNTDDRFSFSFPRAKFVDENNIGQQLIHIRREVKEADDELPPAGVDVMPFAIEVMDIYHSAETELRILEEKHGVNIRDLMLEVAAKNDARGYYDAN